MPNEVHMEEELDSLREENADLHVENEQLRQRVTELEEHEERHLRLIKRLTNDSINQEEADELRSSMAKLTAEVGTLRARIDGFGSVHTMPESRT